MPIGQIIGTLLYVLLILYLVGRSGATAARRTKWATARPIEPESIPRSMQQPIEQLRKLGFEQVGATAVDPPINDMTWHLAKGPTLASVESEPGDKAHVRFATMFANDAVVETDYPISDQFKTADHWVDWEGESIEAAHEKHLSNLKAYRAEHKARIQSAPQTLHGVIERLHTYQEQHARRKARPARVRIVMLVVATLGMVINQQILTDIITQEAVPNEPIDNPLIWVILPLIAVFAITHFSMIWQIWRKGSTPGEQNTQRPDIVTDRTNNT